MIKRTSIAAVFTGLVFAGLVASAQPAAADPPADCPREHFCAYYLQNQTGRRLLAVRGNWTGSIPLAESVFNHGVAFPGADHVTLGYTQNGQRKSVCIHYYPGPGGYKMNFASPGVTLTSVRWRGECRPGEPQP